ncbi:hypothetical protein [Paenibacillus sp. sgz302251]|uniref:hypothetical protein n=1 Tax=Paenibacillus sp. sgz302251 TaxID=3414493 RepID=UPI003C7CE6A8
MNQIRKKTAKTALFAATAALALLLAGCQSAPAADPLKSQDPNNTSPNQVGKEPDTPQKTYSDEQDQEGSTDELLVNGADTESDTNAETSAIRGTDDSKADVKIESEDTVWSSVKPILQGIAIGDSALKVSELHGSEIDSYTLEEESDRIQVLEYDGFAIGINNMKTVQYVEVYGTGISAGLSGLQIGDKPDTALKLLGKPEKQTAYLLTYEAQGALLKIDLDPTHLEIVSIKLLSLH